MEEIEADSVRQEPGALFRGFRQEKVAIRMRRQRVATVIRGEVLEADGERM